MIVPESGAENQPQTSLLVLLRNNLLVSALIFGVLEIWRPYFFLTDDNLDGGLPFFMEMGNHLLHGQSPFYSFSADITIISAIRCSSSGIRSI